MKQPVAVSLITDAFAGRPLVTPRRRLWGSGSSVIVGLIVTALALAGWLLGRQPPAVSQSLFAPAWAAGLPPAAIARSSVDLSYLPSELVVPPLLPAGLQDTVLLEAWVRLYNQVEPIPVWGGQTLTGQALAQSLLDQAIPVVWDYAHICRSGSCSRSYCRGRVCTYVDAQPGVDPIYIRPAERADMTGLVGVLAHEIFHRTQPFGEVGDTRFEEYWAMFILAQVSPADWLTFGAFDPLDPGQLVLWIDDNHLDPYLELEAYPDAITPLWRAGTSVGDPYDSIPAEAKGQP